MAHLAFKYIYTTVHIERGIMNMDLKHIIILITSISSIIGIVYLVYRGINTMLDNNVGRQFR